MVWPILGGIYPILFITIGYWFSTKPYSVVKIHGWHLVN